MTALEPFALAATRAAALACQHQVGRGDGKKADAAATEAMRAELSAAPGTGTVVIGEGEKDDAPMLFNGEQVGDGQGPRFEIAVDPLECTTLCAKGLPGSLATIAFAADGAMADLGPAFYMDKLVGSPALAAAGLEIGEPPEANLERAAAALGKPVSELCVVVLDKPRHEELISRIHAAGARVVTPSDGDVAGALEALLERGGADLLMGIGGTPEGVMTACAVRAVGGFMQGRLAPQLPEEGRAVAKAGLSADRVYGLDDLIHDESFFVATGITGGPLLRSPWVEGGRLHTESILIGTGTVRRVIQLEAENQPDREERA
ncbi:MAG: class II fructose-bisphosphatase [Actinomycetota bacterium]|nr:class II fructose-bisphosphatase [Actinomycetota bacterium]